MFILLWVKYASVQGNPALQVFSCLFHPYLSSHLIVYWYACFVCLVLEKRWGEKYAYSVGVAGESHLVVLSVGQTQPKLSILPTHQNPTKPSEQDLKNSQLPNNFADSFLLHTKDFIGLQRHPRLRAVVCDPKCGQGFPNAVTTTRGCGVI